MVVKRFEVWLVNLEPVRGNEINKARLCVVISPDEVNEFLRTVTVAALTSARKSFPTRVDCFFEQKKGQVALEQIRSVDKVRFIKKLGLMDEATCQQIVDTIQKFFSF